MFQNPFCSASLSLINITNLERKKKKKGNQKVLHRIKLWKQSKTPKEVGPLVWRGCKLRWFGKRFVRNEARLAKETELTVEG